MVFFFSVFFVTLLVAGGAYLISKQICWKEALIMLGVQFLVAGTSALIVYHNAYSDTEVRNSSVVGKKQVRVSCSHSYSCRCRQSCSGSGKNRSCHRVCDTCYEHSNDWDWDVHSAIGETFTINRIDRRGSNEPPRWTAIQMGEPTSRTYGYENYIKAAPDSLFRHQGLTEKYQGKLPPNPQNIYDYYRLNRLVLVNGATVTDPQYWNADISQLNADLGAKKQVNAIVVVTRGMPQEYFYALEQHWIGGKGNDVVVVMDLGADKRPNWVAVMSWEINDIFKVKVRDELMDRPSIERWDVMDVLRRNITAHHQRKPMADFEYLTASFTPSVTEWVVSLVIGLILSIGMSVFFHQHETFPEYRNRYY
jgi:hypothetical protein